MSGREPGKHDIPAEVWECCKGTIIIKLCEILCLCWRDGSVLQDMINANIVTLWHNKDDGSNCNISLLTISLHKFLWKAIIELAERVYPQLPFGLCANRSTWWQLQENRDKRQGTMVPVHSLHSSYRYERRLNVLQGSSASSGLLMKTWRVVLCLAMSGLHPCIHPICNILCSSSDA